MPEPLPGAGSGDPVFSGVCTSGANRKLETTGIQDRRPPLAKVA